MQQSKDEPRLGDGSNGSHVQPWGIRKYMRTVPAPCVARRLAMQPALLSAFAFIFGTCRRGVPIAATPRYEPVSERI